MDYHHRILETFKTEVEVEAFIDWMYREFSSESILSFIEFVQFKQWVKQRIRTSGGMAISLESDPADYQFYDKIPKSTIIYGNVTASVEMVSGMEIVDKLENWQKVDVRGRAKHIAHLLFVKYIRDRSEFQINISGPLREQYTALDQTDYENLRLLEFVSLFDELIGAMMQYIRQSFVRFDLALQREPVLGDVISNTATP